MSQTPGSEKPLLPLRSVRQRLFTIIEESIEYAKAEESRRIANGELIRSDSEESLVTPFEPVGRPLKATHTSSLDSKVKTHQQPFSRFFEGMGKSADDFLGKQMVRDILMGLFIGGTVVVLILAVGYAALDKNCNWSSGNSGTRECRRGFVVERQFIEKLFMKLIEMLA